MTLTPKAVCWCMDCLMGKSEDPVLPVPPSGERAVPGKGRGMAAGSAAAKGGTRTDTSAQVQ